jgi:hypothetical protein
VSSAPERLRGGGPVDVQVPARELEAGVAGVDVRRRHAPDSRLSRALPADQDGAGRRGVPEAVSVAHALRIPRLAVGHPRAAEGGVEAGREVLRPLPALGVVGQRPEREDGQVARGDDEDAEPWPPELNQ